MHIASTPDVSVTPRARRSSSWRSSSYKVLRRKHLRLLSSDSSTALLNDAFGKMNAGLNLGALEQMLCSTIPKVTGNITGLQFQGIATRCSETNDNVSKEELLAVADWLGDFLGDSSSQQLPAGILSDIHSFIGLIRQLNGEFISSQRAYVSAAWIAQRVVEKDQLAVSLYRLGTSFGKSGHHLQMISTLEKAYAVWVEEDEVVDARSANVE
jgi:hypothetical protein